jgi:hypothetical protein
MSWVRRLDELCLRVVVGAGKLHTPQSLLHLPHNLKDRIREILLKRNPVTPDLLACLLHSRVTEIDLEDQEHLQEEHIRVMATVKTFRKINLNRTVLVDKRTHPTSLDVRTPELPNLSSHSLIQLISGQRYLTSLFLRGLSGVSEDVFRTIGSCVQLIHLDVGSCTDIQDQFILHIRDCCRIESLSLSMTDISDIGLHHLARCGCRSTLKELRIDRCINITDDGIQILLDSLDGLSGLEILIFHGCPQVTDSSRVSLQMYLSAYSRNIRQLTWTVY